MWPDAPPFSFTAGDARSGPISRGVSRLDEYPLSNDRISESTRTGSSSQELGLRSQVKAGAAWTTLLTVVSRGQQVVLQVVLAWLLSPGDFGLIALAYTVMAYAWFLQHAGLGAVLIQRQKRFHLWVSPATALVTVTGLLATGLALAAAWPAAHLYGEPRLAGVIAVLAIGVLPDALRSVAQARLRASLRFKAYVQLQILSLLIVFVLTMVFAALDFGVYSFVIPKVAASLILLVVEWAVARPGVRFDRLLGRWRFLITSSLWITLAGLCIQVMNQGDYTVLGLYADKDVVGHYYFAFMLSTQAMMLVTVNVGGVLTPVLARFQDRPALQTDRFFEACGLIALVGIPACFGLALIADPLIRLFFDDRYLPAIPFLQLLSIGMAFRMVGHNGAFLMQANGRWRGYFLLSVTNAVIFVLAALIGVRLGGPFGLAFAVGCFYAMFGFSQLFVATAGPGRGSARRIAELYAVPLLICAPAYGVLWILQRWLNFPPVVALPLLIGAGGTATALTLRVFFSDRLERMMQQLPLAAAWRKVRGGPGAG